MTGCIPRKRWTPLEYDRLIDRGVFQPGDRIELLGGELVVREAQRNTLRGRRSRITGS